MTIHEVNQWHEYDYQVVSRIPEGYHVWNVNGIVGHPDYLPLCVCYSGTYSIQPDKLLAIKVASEEKEIMKKSAIWGGDNLEEVKKRLARKNLKGFKRERFEKALPVFEKYTEGDSADE